MSNVQSHPAKSAIVPTGVTVDDTPLLGAHWSLSRRRLLGLATMLLPAVVAQPLARAADEITVKTGPDLSFITDNATLLRRASWTRQAPEQGRLRPMGECNRITIHHQGAAIFKGAELAEVVAQVNNVYASHHDLGYGDIGYHFIVDYAGRLWEGRSIRYEGAHVSSSNAHNMGVMVLGNFQQQKASKEQMESVLLIVDLLQRKFDIEPSRIYGHLDLGSTICPGRHMYPAVGFAQRHAESQRKLK